MNHLYFVFMMANKFGWLHNSQLNRAHTRAVFVRRRASRHTFLFGDYFEPIERNRYVW
jgi:hypothetical protein